MNIKKRNLIIVLVLFAHLVLLVNLRFIAWPEMILWPYFLLKGLLPYQDIAMAHNPLLIFSLAFFYKFTGVSLLGLKIYTWALILLTDVLVYWVAKKLTKSGKTAILSLVFYVLWQPYFDGNGVWFDLVLAPLALLTFYTLYKQRLSLSGFLFVLAILVKQTAFWSFVPVGLTFILLKKVKFELLTRFALGGFLAFSLVVVYFAKMGIWQDFYAWAVQFGIGYLPNAAGQLQLPSFKQFLSLGVPFAFMVPALALLLHQGKGGKKSLERKVLLLLVVWFLFGSLGVYPRWGLFHFQPALPFLAIISGIMLSRFNLLEGKHKQWFVVYLVLVILGTVYLQTRFYRLHWQKQDRFFESETLQAEDWLKANIENNEKIFILNSWDHLYALSDTLPAVSPWVPTLPWYMDYPGIQEGIVDDLKKEKPSLVVFEPYKEKGLGSYRPRVIDKFLQENYSLSEVVAGRFWILRPNYFNYSLVLPEK